MATNAASIAPFVLPVELLDEIFQGLDPVSAGRCCMVCPHWNNVLLQEQSVWKLIYFRCFGGELAFPGEKSMTWHEKVIRAHTLASASNNPLMWGVRGNHTGFIVRFLQQHGLDCAIRQTQGTTIIHACVVENRPLILQAIIALWRQSGREQSNLTEVTATRGITPLISAAFHGRLECAEHLLNSQANIEVREAWFMQTPLCVACSRGHLNMVQMLLARGADRNVTDRDVWNPSRIAASKGHDEIVRLLNS